MLKSRIKGLVICFTGSSLLVALLYFLSGWMTDHPNGFLRKLPSHQIKGLGFVKLPDKYYYIAGNNQQYLYLASRLHRSRFLVIRIPAIDTLSKRVTGLDTVKVSNGAYLKADSANFYVLDAGKSAMLSGRTRDARLTNIYATPRFTGALPLSKSTAILTIVAKGQKAALVRFSGDRTTVPYILDEQGDGIFSTDGMLIAPPSSNKLFYVYYYRNRIICLDTTLNVLYTGKTIDTNSHVQIKVGQISADHTITLESPPVFVNRHCAINDRWLFVQSALRADNEVASATKGGAVIDVYAVKDGKYRLSFYVPDFANEKMEEFRVCGNTLVALFDHYVHLYQLYF